MEASGADSEKTITSTLQFHKFLVKEDDINKPIASFPNGAFLDCVFATFEYLLAQNENGFVNTDAFYAFIRIGAAGGQNNRNFAAGLTTWRRRLMGVFGYEEREEVVNFFGRSKRGRDNDDNIGGNSEGPGGAKKSKSSSE